MGTETYIAESIHVIVDHSFHGSYRRSSQDLQECIETGIIKLKANVADAKFYVPRFDSLFYPTVSTEKSTDEYDAHDWIKFDQEIDKYSLKGLLIPTDQHYRLKRLSIDLKYLLKIIIQGKIDANEALLEIGLEYFLRDFHFVKANFPKQQLWDEYEALWYNTLTLVPISKAVTRLEGDGVAIPYASVATQLIIVLKAKLGC